MSDLVVTNWFGDLVSHPKVIVEAHSPEDIAAILKDPVKYPSPVRAVGSNHSTSPCGAADGGTLIQMKPMNRILNITSNTVTVEAGALYIDIAHELENHQLQFYVNTEIGSLSAGSAACAGTKDASMPSEFGQVNSYVIALKMMLPSGELVQVDESQPDTLQKVRSSYGTFGIVTEVTFRVKAIRPMAVHHETFKLDDFVRRLPELKARGEAMFFYMFPFDNLITIEFRHYNPGATSQPNRHIWPLRNYFWATLGPKFCHQVENDISVAAVRYAIINDFCALWRFKLTELIRSDNTVATDQIIRYPAISDDSRYTFSLWAFPEEVYPSALPEYFKFCQDYYRQKGYRTNMLNVGYTIAKDQSSLLSYSYDGNVMTIDPVSTANPGWHDFLGVYNDFCIQRGGKALLNQTWGLTHDLAQKSFGDRLKIFADERKKYDPGNRLLNTYFRDLLGE